MARMKQAVKSHFGLEVFPEHRFLGDATQEEQALWEELTGDPWTHD
jgi:hypothetical protein